MTAVDRLTAPDRESSIPDQLGLAVHLMIRRGCYLLNPIASIAAWILPPARLRQLHFFRDPHHNAVGYMTWAFLADDVEVRWRSQTSGKWHLSEWNEGETLWIVDFVALPGTLRACIDQAVRRLGRHGRACYLHRREASQRHTMVKLAAVPAVTAVDRSHLRIVSLGPP